MNLSKHSASAQQLTSRWHGLGLWNLYFLAKFMLAWTGHLNLQLLPNLMFAVALLWPVSHPLLRRARTLIAVPVAVALLYQDTWFPPFRRLLAQPEVLNFSFDYIVELLGRFIDWHVCALLVLMMAAYYFLNPWLRLTTFTLLGFAWLGMGTQQWLSTEQVTTPLAHSTEVAGPQNVTATEPDDATLNAYLDNFYQNEATRKVEFKEPAVKPQPFDVLVLNICSLAWDDLETAGLRNNTLFEHMDVIFDNFNSATGYSGPAALRLLRASCGQSPHSQLYTSADKECLLFDDLRQLGFSEELMLNHNGEYGGFLQAVREQGHLPAPALGVTPPGLQRAYVGFDSSPIWRDRDVLSAWWQHRMAEDTPQIALFYNTVTLHDGNRQVLPDGGTQSASYKSRAQKLLDDLDSFLTELKKVAAV